MMQLLYLRNPGMLLLEIGVRGTPKLRRAGLELLALEAVSVRSFGRKLLWLPASGRKLYKPEGAGKPTCDQARHDTSQCLTIRFGVRRRTP